MNAQFVDGVRHKLENIISGHRINPDDADWLRAILHRTVTSLALSAPDNAEALTDEQIEKALDTKLGLDHTLRKLVRGDTVSVGYSRVHVVRALLKALTPAARVSVSDEDLVLAEEAASYLHDHASFKKMNATRWAGGIYRLVQAVKGDK